MTKRETDRVDLLKAAVQIPGQLSPVAIVTFLVFELFVHAVASLARIPFPGGSHREIVRA
jgi:hypothetical protein